MILKSINKLICLQISQKINIQLNSEIMRSSGQFGSIEEKQAYVYSNILEGDYDIQAFAEYLANQPPKHSSNLEELSFEQVKKAVDSFMQKTQKPKNTQNNLRESTMTESKYDRLSVDYNNMDFYMKSKECVKQINKFALTSIALNVISYKKNEGGFLSRDYITFKIELPQLHKQIERRYSHFEWLRNILAYYHPGIVLPPLPKKKMKKIFTEDHLKKKGRLLQNFLRKCLQIPDLRNDQNIYRFLTITNSQKFDEFLKQNKVQKGFAPIQKMKSASGTIEYGINEQSININKKAAQYYERFTPFMKQLYKEIKRVQQNLGACVVHLQNLQTLSKQFTPFEEQFRRQCNKKQFFSQDQREKSFLQHISILAQRYKQQLKAMKEIWEKDFYIKMKYQFHHSEAFAQYIAQYQSQEKTFYNMKESLKKKKMKVFAKPMTDWDLPQEKKSLVMQEKPSFNEIAPYLLPRKTQDLAQVQLEYALHTKQLCNSIVHYAKNNNSYNLKSLEKFLQKEHEVQSGWSDKLKDMITTQFEFSLSDTKEKLANTGNSIKGFLSQFSQKGQKLTDQVNEKIYKSSVEMMVKKSGIKEVSGLYNGM